ncbi:ABC transporter substrate-binding protein [Trichlorobacter ammonificans]|uniref:Branched-chain amino acid ABC transporter, amino acid-binding protein (TC 3.A.1.4.1) n=1 Tax=Trichlorobacter ammonificans TaxID=2916410 RepID=A0ABM9DBB4_9BACT|nr:ABC transporter substrate-binding protein [Trichlorobacter ammonificans]CAH2031633.1 Branched-chain amino acid ABC transporter, amino acid-binding protein (TC 3.A.1.4.1) [Trichlorobacter ammonificans]
MIAQRFLQVVVTAALCLTSSVALAAGTIKIGGLFAVTGPAAFLGEPERNTAQMVVDGINRSGGIKGQKLELVAYDTAGDATKAVQLATKLIKNDKVVAIVGPSTTGESMAVVPVAEKEKVPLISCAAGSKITDPVKPYVFKTAQNDGLAVARIYEYLHRQKLNRVAILTVSDGFGASGREQLKALAGRYGIQIVVDDTYGPKDTDMTSQLTKIRASQAQAVICWGTNPGPAVVAKNAKQLGIKLPLYMSHGVSSKKFIELAGDAAEGIRLPSGRVIVSDVLPASDPQKKSLLAFVREYQRLFRLEGDHFGGHAWDGVMLIKGAIERGGATPEGIRDALEKTRDFHGIGGTFTFSPSDHAGLTKEAFVMVEIRNRDWTLLK